MPVARAWDSLDIREIFESQNLKKGLPPPLFGEEEEAMVVFYFPWPETLAQESRRVAMRLKTSISSDESASTAK